MLFRFGFPQCIAGKLHHRLSKAGRTVPPAFIFLLTCSFFTSIAAANTFDGPAELPRVYVQSTVASTPAPGNKITVPAGGDIQAAVNAAKCGDTVLLQAGATYVGAVHLTAKPCDDNHWVILRTSAPDSSLPPEGTRMTPCYAGVASLPGRPAYPCSSPKNAMAKMIYAGGYGSSGPIHLDPGANHYRLLGLEITRNVGNGGVTALMSPVKGATANHIVIDRSWLHGTTHDDTAVGVALSDTTYVAVVDSYFSDFHCTSITGSCTDAKTVAGGNSSSPGGPYKIVHNFLEASGENILFGGGRSTITPADIEIRRNHLFKPLQWMPGATGFVGGVSGRPFIVKNHLELKNAQRVLFEANILENTWGGFSQPGGSIVLTPKNQNLSGLNVCPLCQVTDITIRYSTISHVGSGIRMSNGYSGLGKAAGGGIALAGERYSIHDVTIDDVSAQKYQGGGGLILVTNAWPKNVLNSVTINHITGFPDPNIHVLTIGNDPSNPRMWGFVFTNNLVGTGRYPVWTAFPAPDCANPSVPILVMKSCFASYSFSKNALIGSPSAFPAATWPSGNYFPSAATAVQFVNYNNGNGGDYRLLRSSPYANAASDGKDLGADVSAILSATAGVY